MVYIISFAYGVYLHSIGHSIVTKEYWIIIAFTFTLGYFFTKKSIEE